MYVIQAMLNGIAKLARLVCEVGVVVAQDGEEDLAQQAVIFAQQPLGLIQTPTQNL